jgi:hypothetical protein
MNYSQYLLAPVSPGQVWERAGEAENAVAALIRAAREWGAELAAGGLLKAVRDSEADIRARDLARGAGEKAAAEVVYGNCVCLGNNNG